jgi:Ca2+-binding EF-hand superfamily protein
MYKIEFKRSSGWYVFKLVVPAITLTVLSFISFWMNPAIGERLGFAITVILAMFANEITATTLMPVCNEKVLMDYLSFVSMLFGSLSLLETGIVLYIYYQTAESWLVAICPCWMLTFIKRLKAKTKGKSSSMRPQMSETKLCSARRSLQNNKFMERRRQLYRQVFLRQDRNFSGVLELSEIDSFGSFMLGHHWDCAAAQEFMDSFDTNNDGSLEFNEFVVFCEFFIVRPSKLDTDISDIEKMVKAYLAYDERMTEAYAHLWQSRAIAIDRFSRWTIPVGYAIFVLRLYAASEEELERSWVDPITQMTMYLPGFGPFAITLFLCAVWSMATHTWRARGARGKDRRRTSTAEFYEDACDNGDIFMVETSVMKDDDGADHDLRDYGIVVPV